MITTRVEIEASPDGPIVISLTPGSTTEYLVKYDVIRDKNIALSAGKIDFYP